MKLGSEEIFYINTLNGVSGATAKDVVVQGNSIAFLVKQGDFGRAIGKNACNVKALRQKLNKNIEIIEHAGNEEDFIKKALFNVKVNKVSVSTENGKKTAAVVLEAGERMKIFDKMARFKRIKEFAKRNYDIEDIKLK